MTWCRQASSHYLSQYWLRSMSPYGVTRLQWVDLSHTELFWRNIYNYKFAICTFPQLQSCTFCIWWPYLFFLLLSISWFTGQTELGSTSVAHVSHLTCFSDKLWYLVCMCTRDTMIYRQASEMYPNKYIAQYQVVYSKSERRKPCLTVPGVILKDLCKWNSWLSARLQ